MELKFLYDDLSDKAKNKLRAAFLHSFGFKTQASFYRALRSPSLIELDFFLQQFGVTFEGAKERIAELQKESASETFGLKPVQK